MGMEACSSAHHWARVLAAHGHQPKLMAAEFVKPFRKSQGAKNDRNDAQAILSAVREPNMRFVSVKSLEQQSILACHRMRQGWHAERTALLNRTRGLLAEFGIWLARSSRALYRALPRLSQDEAVSARVRPYWARLTSTYSKSMRKSAAVRRRSVSTPSKASAHSGSLP